MRSKYFEEVTRIAVENGFEDGGVRMGLLHLCLNGRLVVRVNEFGIMQSVPCQEADELLEKIWDVRHRVRETEFIMEDEPAVKFEQKM